MNNLFFNLPDELQIKITRMNPHPVADLFKQEMKTKLDEFTEMLPGDYEYGEEDFRLCDDHSFADYFFHECEHIRPTEIECFPHIHCDVYYFWAMDYEYVSTLNEWNRRNQTMIIPVF